MKKIPENHPLGDFLIARGNAIIWLSHEMKKNDIEISKNLSLDSEEVTFIREYFEKIYNLGEKNS